ncbi:MAG: hypothetical protein ABIR32_20380 [Ilumatobacteraceae bacterium]
MITRRTDLDAAACHAAEQRAFAETALDWKPGAEALCGEARSFMETLWWTSTFGVRRCGVEPVQRPTSLSRSSCFSIMGGVIEIRLHEAAARHEVFHQLGHAATMITRKSRRPGHDHEWRTSYLAMVNAAYGADWTQRLADSFGEFGLSFNAWQ